MSIRMLTPLKSTITFVAALFCAGLATAQTDSTQKKPEFKPSGNVWGYAFGDYEFKPHADTLGGRGSKEFYAGQAKDFSSFELRRVYLGYTYNMSPRFTADVLLAHEDDNVGPDGKRMVYVKYANFKWKNIFKNTDLVFGQQPTFGFVTFSESIWGYRSIEKTITDMRGLIGSNDLGISLQGGFNADRTLGYDLMISNGNGAKIENDMFKKMSADVYGKFLNKKLIVHLYADYNRTQLVPSFHKSATTYKAFVVYNSDLITAGAEAFMQVLQNNAIRTNTQTGVTDTADGSAMGVSVFVRGRIIKDKLNYFARYDLYNPDMNYQKSDVYAVGGFPNEEMFITGGIDYMPDPRVHIMPNVWYNGFSNRTNGAHDLAKKDYDMALRLTCWFVFK